MVNKLMALYLWTPSFIKKLMAVASFKVLVDAVMS